MTIRRRFTAEYKARVALAALRGDKAIQEIAAARGLAEAQVIITAGLTPEYLMFHYIQRLAELPAGSVVYVPTEGGIPLMRDIGTN